MLEAGDSKWGSWYDGGIGGPEPIPTWKGIVIIGAWGRGEVPAKVTNINYS